MYFISFLFALLWNGPHQCIAVIYIMFLFVILSFANVNAENIMQKIVASDNVGRFGYSVSMHNNTALVGSYDMMGSSGSAYIFDRIETVNNNSGWTQTTKLVANDSVAPGDFGISVSIDNNIALIASFGDAYIFEKQININQVLWTQTARLVPNDGTAFINFGYSVSIHNNSALIGWPGNGIDSGSAYIFEKVNEIWIQTAKLVPNDAANDHFGTSVSIHNNIALIGSPSPGHAYIFEKVNGAWTQTAKLVANDGVASDNFGTSVSINNNIALIGSPYNDAMGSNSGSAYIFEKDATWTQTAKLVANDGVAGDQFGRSVSIDKNIALIGAWMGSNSESGSAYIFEKVNAIWTQTAKLVANDGVAVDRFGFSVSINNNIALIGTMAEKVYAIKNYNSCYNVWIEASDKNGLLDTQNSYLINYIWTTCMFSRNQTYTITPTHNPTTYTPTTLYIPTTTSPTPLIPTTAVPTTMAPTTNNPTTSLPTTSVPTTAVPTTYIPTTTNPTPIIPTTFNPTTFNPTTFTPTTSDHTTYSPTTSTEACPMERLGDKCRHSGECPSCMKCCHMPKAVGESMSRMMNDMNHMSGINNKPKAKACVWGGDSRTCHSAYNAKSVLNEFDSSVAKVKNNNQMFGYINNKPKANDSNMVGFILFVGLIAFILINNLFICCWCLNKNKGNKNKDKYEGYEKCDIVAINGRE